MTTTRFINSDIEAAFTSDVREEIGAEKFAIVAQGCGAALITTPARACFLIALGQHADDHLQVSRVTDYRIKEFSCGFHVQRRGFRESDKRFGTISCFKQRYAAEYAAVLYAREEVTRQQL